MVMTLVKRSVHYTYYIEEEHPELLFQKSTRQPKKYRLRGGDERTRPRLEHSMESLRTGVLRRSYFRKRRVSLRLSRHSTVRVERRVQTSIMDSIR